MIGEAQLNLIKAERKQWRGHIILNSMAIQKLSNELDVIRKQKDELQAKLLKVEKDLDLTRENAQTDLMIKDNEIGRLMKKITEKKI